MGDRDGFLVKDGKVTVAPFSSDHERFLEKLAYSGPYQGVINQPEGRPATYIISGENFVFTFELSKRWFMSQDPQESRERVRSYIAGELAPIGMWGKHTQIRLYVNASGEQDSLDDN
jgi:hypothetical protein